jgi:5'-nucleotidase
MKTRPRILITNDDGINAPGLYHLWRALGDSFELIICAPSHEQSATGLSITIRTPLRVEKVNWPDTAQAWSVTGTPADCIKLAIHKILGACPDLIVSGINRGSNAGRNVLYSGTVAGVIEGAMRNVPGVAFSCMDYHNPDYGQAEKFIPAIVAHLLESPMPPGTILNVNFPTMKEGEPKGLRLTRQGLEYWVEDPAERKHPAEGHLYYWLGSKLAQFDEHEDSDIAWLREGYVTAVPLQVHDLTNHTLLEQRKSHFAKLFPE